MSTENSESKEKLLEQWTREIDECRESGITVKDWCAQKGIKPKSYYYHMKRVRESLNQNQVVPINIGKPVTCEDKIEIYCGNLKIAIPSGISGECITSIIQVLRHD